MIKRDDLFEDLAKILEYWTDTAASTLVHEGDDLIWVNEPSAFRQVQAALTKSSIPRECVEQVFSEVIRGVLHSVLTSIDGGTALAEKGLMKLVNEGGESLGECLHEDFSLHLMDTGRFK